MNHGQYLIILIISYNSILTIYQSFLSSYLDFHLKYRDIEYSQDPNENNSFDLPWVFTIGPVSFVLDWFYIKQTFDVNFDLRLIFSHPDKAYVKRLIIINN